MRCGRTDCIEKAYSRTPCCSESVCDKHNKTYAKCSRDSCDQNREELCWVCLEYESYYCIKCNKSFCGECNIEPFVCKCT